MTDLATATADRIAENLAAALPGADIVVANESHHHAGHTGDDGSGATHWRVTVTAPAFTGLPRVKRHRLVNAALAELMNAPIHALSIDARAPDEG